MEVLKRHAPAFLLFALVFVLWATAVPVGVVQGHTFAWFLDGQDVGAGKPVRVHGQVVHELHGWGMPGGVIRSGSNAWSASYDGGSGQIPLEVTPAMQEIVLGKSRGAAGPEGVFVDWDDLLSSAGLGFLFWIVTCSWWVGVREWAWQRERPVGNLLVLGCLTFWPWLLGTANGWALVDNLRLRAAAHQPLVPIDLAVCGTALLLSIGLVLLLTRHRWPEADAPV